MNIETPSTASGSSVPDSHAAAASPHVVGLSVDNPWPGPRTYREEWKEFFFGRDTEASELLERVGQSPVTVLYGKSGTGKSSLLQAGLFPRLRDNNFIPIYLPLKVQTRLENGASFLEQIGLEFCKQLDETGVTAPDYRPDYLGNGLWSYLHSRQFELWSKTNYPLSPVCRRYRNDPRTRIGETNFAPSSRSGGAIVGVQQRRQKACHWR